MIICVLKQKRKHAVPCTSSGQVFIVSASAKSVQHSPLVTTWVHGFKTKPIYNLGFPHLLTNANGIAQPAALRELYTAGASPVCVA